jgi:hypothetical protein
MRLTWKRVPTDVEEGDVGPRGSESTVRGSSARAGLHWRARPIASPCPRTGVPRPNPRRVGSIPGGSNRRWPPRCCLAASVRSSSARWSQRSAGSHSLPVARRVAIRARAGLPSTASPAAQSRVAAMAAAVTPLPWASPWVSRWVSPCPRPRRPLALRVRAGRCLAARGSAAKPHSPRSSDFHGRVGTVTSPPPVFVSRRGGPRPSTLCISPVHASKG